MSYHLLFSSSFFFFKQKTAYEMRISDWSSDVCSSDLQKQPEVSLQEFLGDFGTRFAGVSWENTDTSLYFEAHLDANWKVLADAFSETYHIPSIHPATIGKTFASAVNPHSRPLDARFWGPHRQ